MDQYSKIFIHLTSHGKKKKKRGELVRNLPDHIEEEFDNEDCKNHRWYKPVVIGKNGGILDEDRLNAIKDLMTTYSSAIHLVFIGGNDLGEGKKSIIQIVSLNSGFELGFRIGETI